MMSPENKRHSSCLDWLSPPHLPTTHTQTLFFFLFGTAVAISHQVWALLATNVSCNAVPNLEESRELVEYICARPCDVFCGVR